MKRFFHSLRWRIQAWHAVLLLIAIAAFCLTAYQLAWNNQLRRVDNELEGANARRLIKAFFRPDPGEANKNTPPPSHEEILRQLRAGTFSVPEELKAYFQGHDPGYLYFAIIDMENKQTLLASENLPPNFTIPAPTPPERQFFRNIDSHTREVVFFSPPPNLLCTVVGRDITPEKNGLHRYALSLTGCALGLWLLGLLGGWWIAGRTIRPIKKISETATHIANGDLTERIKTDNTGSELDQLSGVLNQTFDQLHAALERQRQFTADASHELRTPITILLSETQRALKRPRTPEEYRDILQTCADTAQRMRYLTEALILLARQESGAPAHHEATNLKEILESVIQNLSPLAKERNIKLHPDLHSAYLEGDPASLSILATNILQNAIQHHRPSGDCNIHIYTGRSDGAPTLVISDDGPGIPEADLPHIFDRFYRSDKTRTTTSITPNSGLGLAITKTIADNHKASISVTLNPLGGSSFSVRFQKP